MEEASGSPWEHAGVANRRSIRMPSKRGTAEVAQGQNERETNAKPGTIQEQVRNELKTDPERGNRANRSAKREIHETQRKEADACRTGGMDCVLIQKNCFTGPFNRSFGVLCERGGTLEVCFIS